MFLNKNNDGWNFKLIKVNINKNLLLKSLLISFLYKSFKRFFIILIKDFILYSKRL